MPPTPSADNILLGKGEVFLKRKEALGTAQGFRHLGNVETLEITTEDENLDKRSSMSAASPLYKRVARARTVTLRAALDEFEANNMALALMGSVSTAPAQAATPIVGEALTADALLGGYYRTALIGPITAVTVKKGATPLVLGTDYAIPDATLGLIQILPGSVTVIAGDALTIDYTPTAYADGWTEVDGGSDNVIEGELMFIGDPTTGPKYLLEVWSVSIAPDGAIGLISEEFAQFGLTMAVQEDAVNHPDNKLYRLTELPY